MKRLLSILMLAVFSVNTCCYGLATLPASKNPAVRDKVCWSLLTARGNNPLDTVKQASEILAGQNANIVFERDRRTKRWIFRRSGMEIKISPALSLVFGNILDKEKQNSFLLTLRGQQASAIENALYSIIFNDNPIQKSFANNGIRCVFDYKKILIISPYGDAAGGKVKYIQPHMGSEIVTYRLNREVEDVDARIYNPNLGSLLELFELFESEAFDAIAFSILRTTLGRTLQISALAHKLAPESMIIFGGYDVKFLPLEDLFASVPCHVGIFDDGTALVKMAPLCGKQENSSLVQRFREIPNLVIRDGNGILKTREAGILMQDYDVYEDIPISEPDLTHGKTYQHLGASISNPTLPLDRIGRNPLSVYYGNLCRGNCIFCFLQRNTMPPPSADELIATIERDLDGHDSLNFECSDILAHREGIKKLVASFKTSRLASIPKKAPARVDGVGDGTVLKELAEAGFEILSFGVESFDSGILAKLNKKTTREQNVRALELSLEAGIRPGINLILYTPWDTIETTMDTIEQSLYFVEKGAYLNIAPRIHVRHGTEKLGGEIEYRTHHYPGMYKPFKIPFAASIRDPELKRVAQRAFKINDRLLKVYAPFIANTVCIKSLLNVKSFYLAYGEIIGFTKKVNRLIQRIDNIIEKAIVNMELTGKMGQEHTFRYNEYGDLAVPVNDSSSSLRMNEYVASKFPSALLNEMRNYKNRIELHSGPQSATGEYLRQLVSNGYSVRELITTPQRIRKYYVIQKGKDKRYIISNSIGFNRELFVMQALFLYQYPEQQISIRRFPCDMRGSLLRSFGPYAGRINKVMFAHNAGFVAEKFVQDVDKGARIIDAIQNDFIDSYVVLTQDQKLILFCEIEYTNGEQIKPAIEFLTDDVNMRGLGIKEVVLYAACGAVGEDVRINDILCYSKVHRYGKEVKNPAPNRVNPEMLSTFLPNVGVHNANFFTVPTVISSSTSFIEKLKGKNTAGIELELAHAVAAVSERKGICFRAMYEVHDKPSAVDQIEKQDTIGEDVPGLRDPDKNWETLLGILRYLQFMWGLESIVRQDAQRVGYTLKEMPPVVASVNESEDDLVKTLRNCRDRSIVAIAGLSGTGKTTYISKQVKRVIDKTIKRKTVVISGDSFVFPKNARPDNAKYPDNHFNMDLIRGVLRDFKAGKRIGTSIYDPAIRGSIKLTDNELMAVKKDDSKALEVSGGIGKVYPLNEKIAKRYKNKMRNKNSAIGVDKDGHVIEVLHKDTKILIFEVTVALTSPNMRKFYDYAYFIWAPASSRLGYLHNAKRKGKRYRHYGREEIRNRFARMIKDEDPIAMPTAESADVIVVNAETESIEKNAPYVYDALFKADNKFLNCDVLQKIIQNIIGEFEFNGIQCRGGIVGSTVYLSGPDGFVAIDHVGDIDLFIEAIGKKDIDDSARMEMREAFTQKLKEELSRYFLVEPISQEGEGKRSIRIKGTSNAEGFIQINVKNDASAAGCLLMNIEKNIGFISAESIVAPKKQIKIYLSDTYYLIGETADFKQIKRRFLDALDMPVKEKEACMNAMCQEIVSMKNEVTALLKHKSKKELINRINVRLYQELASYRTNVLPRAEIEALNELKSLISGNLLGELSYEVKYDTSRLSQAQIDIVETYIDLLQTPNLKIKPRPFSSAKGSKESLIAVYCTGKDFEGEGHVDIDIPEGSIHNYLLKIIGMVNIAFAASNIPSNAKEEELKTSYGPIISFIKNQYKDILGIEIIIPKNVVDALKTLQYIVLILPKAYRVPLKQIEEYNKLAKKALISA